MLQKEFENLTKFEVSAREFEAIHEVYMNSELDKVEFCKMWCKMNKGRIDKANEAKNEEKDIYRKQVKIQKFIDKYTKIYHQIQHLVKWDGVYLNASHIVHPDDYDFIISLGLDFNKEIISLCSDLKCIMHDKDLLKSLQF